MKNLSEFLLEALVGNKINKGDKKFKVIEKKNWKNDNEVFVIVNLEDDYNELIDGKDFWYRDIEPIRKRIKLDIEFGYVHLLGITTGHVTGVLYDGSCRKDELQNYTEVDMISADQFNINYFRENNWLIKQ